MQNFDEIPRGQLSTIILSSLLDGDKYGYEIIEYINTKTNGKMQIKQPSLYSSLKRMEDQKLISSYWRDSDIGGRRHYYSLTDFGKKHLEKWQEDLINSKDAVSKLFKDKEDVENQIQNPAPIILQQENIFKINSSQSKDENKESILVEEEIPPTFVQFDLFNSGPTLSRPEDGNKKSDIKEDQEISVSIKNNETIFKDKFDNNFNKPAADIYTCKSDIDIKTEFNKIRNEKKSFLDSYKEMTFDKEKSSYQLSDEFEQDNKLKTENDIDESENNLLSNTDEQILHLENSNSIVESVTHNNENDSILNESKKDDAVLITENPDPAFIPKVKRIEPARFEVYISDNSIVPNIDHKKYMTYKDRVKELYQKSKNNAENQILYNDDVSYFTNFKELKEYYNNRNINFMPYEKPLSDEKDDFNFIKINKLKIFSSGILLIYSLVISLLCGLLFPTITLDFIKSFNFLYFVIPSLYLIYFIVSFIIYIKNKNKRLALKLNSKLNLTKKIFLVFLLVILIFSVNLIFGMTLNTIFSFATTSIYLSLVSLIIIIEHLVNIILYKNKFFY